MSESAPIKFHSSLNLKLVSDPHFLRFLLALRYHWNGGTPNEYLW